MYQNTYGIQPEEGLYVDARDNFDKIYYVAQIVKVKEEQTKVEVEILNCKGKVMTVVLSYRGNALTQTLGH